MIRPRVRLGQPAGGHPDGNARNAAAGARFTGDIDVGPSIHPVGIPLMSDGKRLPGNPTNQLRRTDHAERDARSAGDWDIRRGARDDGQGRRADTAAAPVGLAAVLGGTATEPGGDVLLRGRRADENEPPENAMWANVARLFHRGYRAAGLAATAREAGGRGTATLQPTSH